MKLLICSSLALLAFTFGCKTSTQTSATAGGLGRTPAGNLNRDSIKGLLDDHPVEGACMEYVLERANFERLKLDTDISWERLQKTKGKEAFTSAAYKACAGGARVDCFEAFKSKGSDAKRLCIGGVDPACVAWVDKNIDGMSTQEAADACRDHASLECYQWADETFRKGGVQKAFQTTKSWGQMRSMCEAGQNAGCIKPVYASLSGECGRDQKCIQSAWNDTKRICAN